MLAVATAVPTLASAAFGQITATWISVTSGFWNQPSRWSVSPNFPNDNEMNVLLPGTAAYTVTLNAPSTVRIASLTMTNPNATLLHTGAVSLQFDDFMNIQAGTYSLDTATLLLGAGIPFAGATNAGRMNVLNSQVQWLGASTSNFQNTGTINITNSSMQVGQLINSGTINLSNSSLVLVGDTGVNQLNNVTFANNSLLRVHGDLDLQGQNVSPSYAWQVQVGSVSNGTISAGAGSSLQILGDNGDDNSYFRNVYVNAPIRVSEFGFLNLDADSQIAPGQTITLDTGDREGKRSRAFCSPVRVLSIIPASL